MSFSELENDTLNQFELNEIKIDQNNQMFEVPGQNENLRRHGYVLSRIPHFQLLVGLFLIYIHHF
jgi:hypothetical protein